MRSRLSGSKLLRYSAVWATVAWLGEESIIAKRIATYTRQLFSGRPEREEEWKLRNGKTITFHHDARSAALPIKVTYQNIPRRGPCAASTSARG